jgi:myo-inositol-1(or 4)-monophosphatase
MDTDLAKLQQCLTDTVQQHLMPLFNTVSRQYKHDGSVVTIADNLMQQTITEVLQRDFPEIKLLGEEMTAAQQAELLATGEPLWCLDPIDGTSNFASGMPFFSISLALIENGEVTLGLVYDPVMNECFAAKKGAGAWLNGQSIKAEISGLALSQTLAIIDFKRLPKSLSQRLIDEKPYGSQRSLGSIALELCWLAAGRAQLYLHGRQQIWDYAAAQLIVEEAGAFACTLDNEAVFTRSLTPRSTCAAIDENLFAAWRDYLHVPRCDG